MAVTHSFYLVQQGQLQRLSTQPTGCRPLIEIGASLLPPQISDLHRSFRAWQDVNLSIGEVLPRRFGVTQDNGLLIQFPGSRQPATATFTSAAQELAGWLLLLDQWMETFVVIARARTVWNVHELGAAMPFLSPAYLPKELRSLTQENWQRLSLALAIAVADGEMAGEPTNRHWKK